MDQTFQPIKKAEGKKKANQSAIDDDRRSADPQRECHSDQKKKREHEKK